MPHLPSGNGNQPGRSSNTIEVVALTGTVTSGRWPTLCHRQERTQRHRVCGRFTGRPVAACNASVMCSADCGQVVRRRALWGNKIMIDEKSSDIRDTRVGE